MAVLLSALALLVSGVAANHQYLAVAADDLAVLADPLHACSNLHDPETPMPTRWIYRKELL
jgi:hypothetical protein